MNRVEAAMRRAIELAGRTQPHPNPRVGAVLLSSAGDVVGEAVHTRPGEDHAERALLARIGPVPDGATLVVTLEPCDHTGRTPPCTDAIIEAGIDRVVVGTLDPDGRVSGRGVERLRAAGVTVEVGVLETEAQGMDAAYHHHRRTGRPLVTLKQATTLDGQTAAADGTSKWITSQAARDDAHALRASHDAVLVGAGTARADDPRLDVRLPGFEGPQPRPIVVAGTRPLPPDLQLWERDPVVIASEESTFAAATVLKHGRGGVVDLGAALMALPGLGILSVLVEGGASVAASVLRSGAVTRGILYLAGGFGGGAGRGSFDAVFASVDDVIRVDIDDVTRIGPDLRVEWTPRGGGSEGP